MVLEVSSTREPPGRVNPGGTRKNGTVSILLKAVAESLSTPHETEWINVCKLNMKFCAACMAFVVKKSALFCLEFFLTRVKQGGLEPFKTELQ